ncbi:homologous recombination OB-fold protein isoform X2 [Syngnathus typhle]|uniref:homologous recombination OB-fold protein isoform X2 n=1 Tax=Syngnathus typhle TaxID=161592 RepID=UPI002A69DE52|nr:homologous recombination OB-fold protein isoform X2 [Syngnathus typhle]
MSCHLGGLFSIGEDFDDEDLLGTHWAAGPQTTVPSHPVDATGVSGTNLQRASLRPTSETVAPTLRKLSSGTRAFHRHLPVNPEPHSEIGSRPAITRVPRREPGASLLQPNVVESLLASKQVTPALQDLTSGTRFLRPNLPPALSLPKHHVGGAQASPATNEPFRPLGRKTSRELSPSFARACALPSPDSGSARAGRQPCPVPTAVVASRPLGATPAATRASGSNLLQPSDERPAHSLAPTARHVTEPPSALLQKPSANVAAQDDFDDWDLDLADLEACERLAVPSAPLQALGGGTLRAPTSTATSLAPNTLSRSHCKPQRAARSTPGPSGRPRGLFETAALVASPSSSPAFSPHPLSTPLLTNHLVQLVSASNKVSRKRPRSEPRPPKTRRFPGPAGLLPEEPPSHSLDEIVVSVPQIPASGVAARLPHQVSCSQSEEEDFGGPWAAMKAEMGLDDRNPACFLCSFSVVMVLRKAALKQLNKNKVPNMAVMLKSINHTHADAKAVFRDPTGEIRGTVHRRLLEERLGELKVGAVLLLKQVGVFSPSHCNHYLNVTPNNLLRIYSPDGGCHKGQLPPSVLEPSPAVEPVSCTPLVFDGDNAGADDGSKCKDGSPQASGWDADDLDELLVALSEDTYSL